MVAGKVVVDRVGSVVLLQLDLLAVVRPNDQFRKKLFNSNGTFSLKRLLPYEINTEKSTNCFLYDRKLRLQTILTMYEGTFLTRVQARTAETEW